MRRALVALLLLFGMIVTIDAIATSIPVPSLTARVTDQTGTLSSTDAQALESKLASFEHGKGSQIAILIVPTTGDETIEQYSIRVVDAWKLGRKDIDDGVLLLVAKDDRKVRIEVGKGLEGVIPDAITNRIIDGFMTPKFLAGDYSGGLNDGVDRIMDAANGDPLPQPTDAANAPAAIAPTGGVPIPAMTAHVVNQTYLLRNSQVRALDAKLAAFETAKGRKIAVLLVESTADETSKHYSSRVFDTWGLGNEGVLIFVSVAPYDMRIVAGGGLAGVFPPGMLRRILDEDMAWPRVKLGDTAGAINGGIDRIIRLENGEAMPPPPKPENSFSWWTLADWFGPPPLGTWTATLVGLIFVFFCTGATLAWKSALVRGLATFVTVGAVPLFAGSGIGFALVFAIAGAILAVIYLREDGPEPSWDTYEGRHSSASGWSILGTIASGLISTAVRSGGGGGFRGGGGGFSGGGASGRW